MSLVFGTVDIDGGETLGTGTHCILLGGAHGLSPPGQMAGVAQVAPTEG